MTWDELEARGRKLYGRKWKHRVVDEMQIPLQTIYGWKRTRRGVPGLIDRWFDVIERERNLQRIARKIAP